MKHIITTFVSGILFPIFLHAQLLGNYTIGGLGPNYSTITAAFNDLQNKGVSGPVVFNIRDGIYYAGMYGITINGISKVNNITFQSESQDSSKVLVVDSSGGYPIFYLIGAYFTLNRLTLKDTINFVDMGGATITKCIVIGDLQPSAYINYYNNRIDGYFDASSGGDIENNIIMGGISLVRNKFIFNKNIVYGDSGRSDLSIAYNEYSQIIANEIYCDVDLSISEGNFITANKFFSNFYSRIDYADLITNNFCYKNVELQSDSCNFLFNNCIPDSNFYFLNNGSNNMIENNIMPQIFNFGDTTGLTLRNNSYGSSPGGTYDSYPLHIDPDYLSINDLHAENTQLVGKAIPFPTVKYDIDSLIRPALPTIGANELSYVGFNEKGLFKNEIKLYPNPAIDELNIETMSFHIGEKVTISIENIIGQVNISHQLFCPKNGIAMIDISNLSQGLYFIEIEFEGMRVVKKFIKQ